MNITKGDYGMKLAWTLYESDGSTPFDISDYSVTFNLYNNNGVFVSSGSCEKIGEGTDGTVTFTIPQDFFPLTTSYIACFKVSQPGQVISFEKFTIQVV